MTTSFVTSSQFATPSGGGFADFLSSVSGVKDHPAALNPQLFAQALSMDLQTLARFAHVHRNTVTRAPESQGVQAYLREALRVLRAGADLTGDMGRALSWYRNEPLQPFGYKTAETLVSEGRTEDLLRYIESLEAGAAG